MQIMIFNRVFPPPNVPDPPPQKKKKKKKIGEVLQEALGI